MITLQQIIDNARSCSSINKSAKPESKSNSGKNPNAVALGKLGGEKGGPARAKALPKEEKAKEAKHAANARWHHGA